MVTMAMELLLTSYQLFIKSKQLRSDVGKTFQFSYDVYQPEEYGAVRDANAFIKVLNPATGWSTTAEVSQDSRVGQTWTSKSLSLEITAGMEGQLIQFGADNHSNDYSNSVFITITSTHLRYLYLLLLA